MYRTCHEHLNVRRNFRSLNPGKGIVLASCIHMSTPCARLEYVASTLHRSRNFICWLTTLGSANVVAESSRIRAQDSCELIAKFPATTCSESAMSHFQLLVLHLSRDNHQVASSLRNRAGKTVPSFLFLILVTSVHLIGGKRSCEHMSPCMQTAIHKFSTSLSVKYKIKKLHVPRS